MDTKEEGEEDTLAAEEGVALLTLGVIVAEEVEEEVVVAPEEEVVPVGEVVEGEAEGLIFRVF